jgi:GrpB-like predicted nucleotidyltransferase (UPF0157 family)
LLGLCPNIRNGASGRFLEIMDLKAFSHDLRAEYNLECSIIFKKEAGEIRKLMRSGFVKLEHVGSNAIIGMVAKPKIDILLVASDSIRIGMLELIGHRTYGELLSPLRWSYFKRTPNLQVNLHVLLDGDQDADGLLLDKSSKSQKLLGNTQWRRMNLFKVFYARLDLMDCV